MFNIKLLIFFVAVVCLIIPSQKVFSQFESHPELEWFTIETPHFYINYHEGSERTANTVAKIAEEIYGPITSLYNYQPDKKVSFIINDVSDVANGAADYYGNRIEIYATSMDYDLRGTHNWLRNVITHEFTHIIQVQSSMKFSRKMPALYLQWLGYENEVRPDVLYGYPNIIVSYPLSGVGVPSWFAEGTAQYQRQQLSYEYWDSHRDMIMRSYSDAGNMLSWNEMGQFASVTSLKAESIYNSGYSLTRYIADKYGEDKLKEISKHLGDFDNFSMDKAIRRTLGKDGDDLYNEWKAYLKNDYEMRLKNVKKDIVEGEVIEKLGFANYNPKFSPDGKKISFESNQDYDYGTTGLFLYDISTKKKTSLTAPVATNYSWSPDGKKILFAKRNSPPNIHHKTVFDLYIYDLSSKDEKQLTEFKRAFSPNYSPDGLKMCFVVNGDGTTNLMTADAFGKNIKALTNYKDGEQVYNPKFSPDGKKIIFEFSYEENRKIAEIDLATDDFHFVIDEPGIDTRNPVYSPDGSKIYFASDRTGIFNIYSINADPDSSQDLKQITNVTGGAFMPAVDGKGNMVYSQYTSTGYKIALLKDFKEYDPSTLGAYIRGDKRVTKYAADTVNSAGKFNWIDLNKIEDKNTPIMSKSPYKSLFTSLSIVPLIRFDTYKRKNQFSFIDAIKPGLYFFSDEMLSRFSIFGGASINLKGERDIFMEFAYDNGFPLFKDLHFSPRFTLAGYNVSRKSDGLFAFPTDTPSVPITYDLLSFDFGMAFHVFNDNHLTNLGFSYSSYAYINDAFSIPQSNLPVRSSRTTYFKASDFSLTYNYESTLPGKNSDINPIRRKFDLRYDYEISKIDPESSADDQGNIITNFQTNKLHKLEGTLSQAIGLFDNTHSITLKLHGATIFGPPVDDFYNYYATGLPGMKGYPFYALGGGRVAHANLTYRLPVFTNIDTRISPLYLDKLYFSIYGDIGNAWNGSNVRLKDFKTDVGAQLRLQAFSFYVFPTSIFFDAAYGFDEFSGIYQNQKVTYGKDWNFYFGMLFGFDL